MAGERAAVARRFDRAVPIAWEGEIPGIEPSWVEEVVRDAVRRAVAAFLSERSATGGALAAAAGPAATGEGPATGAASYQVPSYEDDGEPVALPLLEPEPTPEPDEPAGPEPPSTEPPSTESPSSVPPSTEPAATAAEPSVAEPSGAGPGTDLVDRPSPFEGRLVAIFPRFEAVSVESERYAVTDRLATALDWGRRLFGGRSFVLLEELDDGPRAGGRYYAVSTDAIVRTSDVRLQSFRDIAGVSTVAGAGTFHWQRAIRDRDDRDHRLRALVTVEGDLLFPPDEAAVEDFVRQMRATPPSARDVDPELARRMIFGEIDRLLAAGDRAAARERLVDLDADAFAFADWETKVRYLDLLLDGTPSDREEAAILEIFRAVAAGGRRGELDAMIARLRRRGIYGELFDDMDRIWSLLVLVGSRFGSGEELSADDLLGFLCQAGLIPELTGGIPLPGLPLPHEALVIELAADAHEAVLSFIRFAGDTVESVAMLLSEPQKVVEGVAQLVRLAIAARLALAGHRPSQELIAEVTGSIGRQLLAGFEGARILDLEQEVVRRIKWAIIWEVASMFIGVGEVRAAMRAVGLTPRILSLGRIGRILGLAGRASGSSRAVRNFERLVAAIGRARPGLGGSDELIELISRLPESDIRRIGRLLDGVDLEDGADLASLGRVSGELRAAAESLAEQASALRTLAGRAGGLSDEVVEAFGMMSERLGLRPGAIERLAWAIPEGEAGRFAAVVRAWPAAGTRLTGEAGAELLELVAGSRQRMDAVLEHGAGLVERLHRSSGGVADVFDGYLGALDEVRQALPPASRNADFQRFLDRLRFGDARAWLRLEGGRRAASGGRSLAGVERVIKGDFLAGTGLRRLIRGRHDDLLDDLLDDMLDADPDLLQAQLARIGSLTDEETRGLALAHRVGEAIPGPHGWSDLLDLDPAHRGELLALMARVQPSLADEAGMARLLGRGLAPPSTNVQGTLGHLWAARTLQRRYPGARMRFEVEVAGREVDIRVTGSGRTVDVEVKTGLRSDPPISRRQIRRDLIRHLGDRFEDLLYLYHPGQAGVLEQVESTMIRALGHADVTPALSRAGISRATAEAWLRQRIRDGLVSTYRFE